MSVPDGRRADKPRLTQRPSYRWAVLGMGFLGVFGGVGLGRFAYSAMLPSMQIGLQINSASAGALASGVVASGTPLAMVIAGPLVPMIIIAGGADAFRTLKYSYLLAGAVYLAASLLAVALREARPNPRT